METRAGTSVRQFPSRGDSIRSVGSATPDEPVKRGWSFARLFRPRVEKEEEPPQILVPGCQEAANYPLFNPLNPRHNPEIKARSTWGSLHFLSRPKYPVSPVKDPPAEKPLRRSRSTLGIFTGTLKSKSFFKRGSISTDRDAQSANNVGPMHDGGGGKADVHSTFAPILSRPSDSTPDELAKSDGGVEGDQQNMGLEPEAIVREDKHTTAADSIRPTVSGQTPSQQGHNLGESEDE
ncbi:hypothetical protein FQN49_006640, partial [Arthroderma sp. PD_2]